MDILLNWRVFKTTFKHGSNETEISMELRPLKRWAMLTLMPFASLAAKVKDVKKPDAKLQEEILKSQFEVQGDALKIFQEHVRNIDGITIDGQAVTPEMLSDESVFFGLAIEIIGELMKISSLGGNDEKNSDWPPNTQTEVTITEQQS